MLVKKSAVESSHASNDKHSNKHHSSQWHFKGIMVFHHHWMGDKSISECQCVQKNSIWMIFCLNNAVLMGKVQHCPGPFQTKFAAYSVLALATHFLTVATNCDRPFRSQNIHVRWKQRQVISYTMMLLQSIVENACFCESQIIFWWIFFCTDWQVCEVNRDGKSQWAAWLKWCLNHFWELKWNFMHFHNLCVIISRF